jgi:hypothetical protein
MPGLKPRPTSESHCVELCGIPGVKSEISTPRTTQRVPACPWGPRTWGTRLLWVDGIKSGCDAWIDFQKMSKLVDAGVRTPTYQL